MSRVVPRLTSEQEIAVTAGDRPVPKLPGTGGWCPALKADGSKTAWFWCPRCGLMGSLAGHEIDAQGNVTPSVLCGYNGYIVNGVSQECGFHESGIRLEGWTP